MRSRYSPHWLMILLLGVALTDTVPAAADHDHAPLTLGHIEFPTSATGEAQEEFIAGMLALYHLWYGEARPHFRRAQKIDPGFGMAYWGEAMTYDNALLIKSEHTASGYSPEKRALLAEPLGREIVARMDALDAEGKLRWTKLERGFADAVRQRFHEGWDRAKRRQAYADAMARLSEDYPSNDHVTVLRALSIMALPGFDKTNPDHVVAVAGRLEEIYERKRRHPGVVLYLAHVYDSATFALMGLRQARRLMQIAPSAPHALLAAGYLFGRLGMWQDCARATDAAYRETTRSQQRMQRPVHARVFRTLEWSMECHLRAEEYADAKAILKELDAVEAEIERRGEEWGEFPEWAKRIRSAYSKKAPK